MELNSATMEPSGSIARYAIESSRPLSSLVFVAPLLLIYELGVVLFGPHALRNGADVWLRHFLEWLGFGQYFLLPLLTCGILLSWHYMRRDMWRVHASVLTTMLLECVLLAMLLFAFAHLQRALCLPPATIAPSMEIPAAAGTLGRLVGYCGAGIYEELLFRVILLPMVASVLLRLGLTNRAGWGWAIFGTSFIFSAAHYQLFTAGGYHFEWYTFMFRLTAGVFFAVLFVFRGFGIAAGSHALYDILVEIL